jgi:crossover junction endodeoxyribonuclease RusA
MQRKPVFRIWVEGHPQSLQGSQRGLKRYKEHIRNAARQVVPNPTKSKRIDIEILFQAERPLRADVDNIIKPVLDALKGIVYLDDLQVRSVRATALPSDDAFGITGSASPEVFHRLMTMPPKEFLINIFEGLTIAGNLGI